MQIPRCRWTRAFLVSKQDIAAGELATPHSSACPYRGRETPPEAPDDPAGSRLPPAHRCVLVSRALSILPLVQRLTTSGAAVIRRPPPRARQRHLRSSARYYRDVAQHLS